MVLMYKKVIAIVVGAFLMGAIQVSAGRALVDDPDQPPTHVMSKRRDKIQAGVEIVALCTQQCGEEGRGSHPLSLEHKGNVNTCANVCNVTSVKRTVVDPFRGSRKAARAARSF